MTTMNPETIARRAAKRIAEATARRAELIRRLRQRADPENPNCIYTEMLIEMGEKP